MLLMSTYENLLKEIELYQNRLEDLQREDYALRRFLYNQIELDVYVERKNKINNESAIIQAILDDKEETKRNLLNKLGQLEGLEYKIAYKRYVEGKRLNEIADELGYSYQYTREIASKTYKEPTK